MNSFQLATSLGIREGAQVAFKGACYF